MPAEVNGQDKREKSRRSVGRIVRRAAITAVVVYGILLVAAIIFQKRMTYYPQKLDKSVDLMLKPGDREVWIDVKDVGRIHGIHHPAPEGARTILFLHGNAGSVLTWRVLHDQLGKLGTGVLTIDYPGYGKSEGTPSEEALYASARAAVKFLNNSGIEDGSIILFGKSLGTGVAVEVASTEKFAGLILESPFTDIASVGQEHFWFLPVRFLLSEKYDSLSKIGRVECPLLVIVGTGDTLVSPGLSEELFSAANQPKEYLEIAGAGHNDIQSVGAERYWDSFSYWLKQLK